MYEFHGWIALAETTTEIDEGGLSRKCRALQERIESLTWSSAKAELLMLNGRYMVNMHGFPNRRRSEAKELEELIAYILKEFKGAYGLIYELDDQVCLPSGRGAFSVSVLRRGVSVPALDPFLSPTIPSIEDDLG